MIYQTLITLILFIGIIFTIIEIVRIDAHATKEAPRVVYKYIPRTFNEEQEDPVDVSEIFYTMFQQPSPWVSSIRTYDVKKQENINKYFASQL